MTGVTLGGGFARLEHVAEDEQKARDQVMRRHFPQLGGQPLTHEERVAELTGQPTQPGPPTTAPPAAPAVPEFHHGPRGAVAPSDDEAVEAILGRYFPASRPPASP